MFIISKLFQDDLARMANNVLSAQQGNKLIEIAMETKLLDLHADKSCFILVGSKKAVSKMKNDLESTPLTLYGEKLKNKESEHYLGDVIHSAGNAAFVEATVEDRYGRIVSFITNSRSIIDDCRINVVGGLSAGVDLWELAYVPSLLNNCESWIYINKTTIDRLESLQNMMYRV